MKKAILVMDMPDNCRECVLCIASQEKHTGQFCWRCVNHPTVMIERSGKKPDWCPLCELPEKKPTIGKASDNDMLCMNAGYNDCIDNILRTNKEKIGNRR